MAICSARTREEIKNFRTQKEQTTVTALKAFYLSGVYVLAIATGNNWENGIESLGREMPICLELKEVMPKDFNKYLHAL